MHWYNDIDPFCCEVLRARIADGSLPDGVVDDRDIRTIQSGDVVRYHSCHFFAGIGGIPLGLARAGWPERIWTGGFPCQDISSAGKGEGLKGSRSGLWWWWHGLIIRCRPDWLLLENVPALRTRGVDHVIASLEGAGYRVADPIVVGAEHVGAPHRRHRVWIVAHAEHDGRAAWSGEHGDETESRIGRRKPSGGVQLADTARGGLGADGSACGDNGHADECDEPRNADSAGLRESRGSESVQPKQSASERAGRHQWPARPGERQHEWEAPRLSQFEVGAATDGVPVKLVRFANRNALKAVGNSVAPQVVEAIGRAMQNLRTTAATPQGEKC